MRDDKTFEEIRVGDEASIRRVLTANDPFIFAHAPGNLNPLHLPQDGGATWAAVAALYQTPSGYGADAGSGR